MRALEFLKLLTEKQQKPQAIPGDPNSDPLYSLKSAIAHKIKDLPDTPEVKAELQEIEDALKHLDTGKKRRGAAEEELGSWSDEDVKSAKGMLARYIISLNAPVEYRREMLEIWKTEGLINIPALLNKGQNSISKIVKRYGKNPAIAEMTNDLLQVDSLGKGKGEFMLKVLSPKLTSTKSNKGDIELIGKGTIEVKTNNVNAARLADDDVKPAGQYSSLVKKFLNTFGQYWIPTEQEQEPQPAEPVQPPQPVQNQQQQPVQNQQQLDTTQPIQPQGAVAEHRGQGKAKVAKPKKIKPIPKSGLNIEALHELFNRVPKDLKNDYKDSLVAIIQQIFPKKQEYAEPIALGICAGQISRVKQYYGVASVLNYMEHKDDLGILFIDMAGKDTTFTFFTDNKTLNDAGLRVEIKTAYPVSEAGRTIYPPTYIVKTGQQQPELAE
jgi:hypothetical protein